MFALKRKKCSILFAFCEQYLVFNSLTNCLGPRKLLHSGKVRKKASVMMENKQKPLYYYFMWNTSYCKGHNVLACVA